MTTSLSLAILAGGGGAAGSAAEERVAERRLLSREKNDSDLGEVERVVVELDENEKDDRALRVPPIEGRGEDTV